MSRLFQNVKSAVTARQAAEMYGLKVGRNSLACCPFHHDKTPSMKVDDRDYCFGCGVTGDAVDLTAQLLRLSPKDAALRLAADFGIEVDEKARTGAFRTGPGPILKRNCRYGSIMPGMFFLNIVPFFVTGRNDMPHKAWMRNGILSSARL